MKTKLEINITKEDIEGGIRRNHTTCPIAIATKRAFKRKRIVSVDRFNLRFTANRVKEVIVLPLKAKNFISNFDNGCKVKPFKFVISYGK
ncbi:hypothetical protein LCGC14_0972360 [marine sediment metagenome]|uniref:Uncharacterized protein n=1 Tax=marine sediment metagenome TaxID=412755 RepID=A0A0F9NFR6_9ZZZZ